MEIVTDSNTIKLSTRETEVCNLLLMGNSTTKISELLKIKCNTVSTIKKSIFFKTKTTNLIELYEVYKQA
jgi:DNA-binding NarL/FixJ family response regulator